MRLEREMLKHPPIPAPAEVMIERLVGYLSGRVGPDGRVCCPCRSRPLESALASRLLEDEGRAPDELARVRTYLLAAANDPDNTELDRALIAGALGLPSRPLSDDEVLPTFSHHSAARKQVLIDTVMYLCRARDDLPLRDDKAFEATDLHSWKRSEMAACAIIHAQATGHPERVRESDLDVVARPLRGPTIHERNHFSHLLYLFALRPYTEFRDLVDAGRLRLLATQGRDGGFTLTEDMDVWVTAVTGLALAEAGADRDLLKRIGDWVAAQQRSAGGWSYSDGVLQTDMDSTYPSLKLLHRLGGGERYTFVLWRGHDYVRRTRNDDGGWPIYRRGNPSESAMTGGALAALCDRAKPNSGVITTGVDWLVRAQHRDGTFERSYSLSEGNAISRAVDGICDSLDEGVLDLDHEPSVQRLLERVASFLAESQNGDGGWGHRRQIPSDPISTGFALAALGRVGHRELIPAAVAYLDRHQQLDGSILSRADTVSPRPIVIDMPDLSSAYVLRGLVRGTRPRLPDGAPSFGRGSAGWNNGVQTLAPDPDTGLQGRPGPNACRDEGSEPRTGAVIVPPLYCPFPLAIHPKAAEVEAGSIAFLDTFHLYRDATQRQRLVRARIGRLCAYQNPVGTQELLQVYTDFMAWVFAFDDEYCDEGSTRDKPVELANAIGKIQRAAEISEYVLDPSDRYATALRDVRRRFDRHAGRSRGEDFVQWLRGWFQTEVQKAGNVSERARPNLDDYAVARMYGGGGMVFPSLTPIVAGHALGDDTLADRRVHALLEMAATVCAWDTDLFSYAKEHQRSNDGYNVVEVIRSEYGLSLHEAIRAAIAMRDRILCLYIRLRRSVTEAVPEVGPYCRSLEGYMRGTIQWSEETDRYRRLDGLSGPEAMHSGGTTNTPSDDTPGPLPLASIAWWWGYDSPAHRVVVVPVPAKALSKADGTGT